MPDTMKVARVLLNEPKYVSLVLKLGHLRVNNRVKVYKKKLFFPLRLESLSQRLLRVRRRTTVKNKHCEVRASFSVHNTVGISNPEVSVPLSNLVDGWFVTLSLHSTLRVWLGGRRWAGSGESLTAV